MEVNTRNVRPLFCVGDSATVKLGFFAGRRGIIEEVGRENVILRDRDSSQEVQG